jgi:FkbM family methyltransferase
MNVKYYEFLVENMHPAELVEFVKKVMQIKRRYLTVDDLTFFIDPVSHFGIRILRDKSYEPEVRAAIENTLQAGDNFIDLGGNESYFSLVASRKVGLEGKVFCIEPQERLWPVILKNITVNEAFNIQLLPFAIANDKGELDLVLTPSINTGSSKIAKNIRTSFWTRQKIKTFTLDEIIRSYNIDKVKLIKIDIEGYELFALKSATEALKKGLIENLIIEVHPNQLRQFNQSVEELVEFLYGTGYETAVHHKHLNLFIFKYAGKK